MEKVTITDIAKIAGVSVATVSKALNDSHDISVNTKRWIRQLARELNYTPNTFARALVTGKTNTICLLLASDEREVMERPHLTLDQLPYIQQAANENGSNLLIYIADKEKTGNLGSFANLCRNKAVDGVIVSGVSIENPYFQTILQYDIPCVAFECPITKKRLGNVESDNVQGGYLAAKHLLDYRHSNIGLIKGFENLHTVKNRLKGFMSCLEEKKVTVKPTIVYSDYTVEGGMRALNDLLKANKDITAVFCDNDYMAIGAIIELKRHGYRIPDDISVVGYDNVFIAEYYDPPITTVSHNLKQWSYEAVTLLVNIINGEPSKEIRIPMELIIRESTRTLIG